MKTAGSYDLEKVSAERWSAAMRRGDFALAWKISDEILARRLRLQTTCWDRPRHLQSVWNGAPLAGKRVLVRCYHGLGDTIQFIRFARALRKIAREVVVWAQPELVSLVGRAPGVDRAVPLHDGTPDTEYEVDIEIMELPHALRTSSASLPRHVPYLFPRQRPSGFKQEEQEEDDREEEEEQEEARLRVGLVWRAGNWDERRSVPADLLASLCRIDGARLLSLQRGDGRTDVAQLGISEIGSDDVEEAAATIRSLDLVISVDTMIAHLAGALGVRAWILLKKDCDWRWMDDRSDSPWYPSMRLFRQPRAGDWDCVISEVETALKHLVRRRTNCSGDPRLHRQQSNGTNVQLWRSDWR